VWRLAAHRVVPVPNQRQLLADLAVAGDKLATLEWETARFIDTTRWFCYQTLCPLVIGRTIAYADSGHITKTYAQQLSGVFTETLHKTLLSRR
jgi:hypothetical protein